MLTPPLLVTWVADVVTGWAEGPAWSEPAIPAALAIACSP